MCVLENITRSTEFTTVPHNRSMSVLSTCPCFRALSLPSAQLVPKSRVRIDALPLLSDAFDGLRRRHSLAADQVRRAQRGRAAHARGAVHQAPGAAGQGRVQLVANALWELCQ